MKQVIIIFITLWVAQKISEQISRLRSTKLQITLEIFFRIILMGFSIYFKMWLLTAINSLIVLVEIVGIILLKEALRALEEAEREKKRENERDGIVYVLSENEYREID